MIKAIIVEDEASLRTLIKKFVTEVDEEISIVADEDNINDAEKAIRNHQPDIIFLDIVLPGGNAFDLLERLGAIHSEVIFITAYDKYFLDAFKHAAIGYLLKPVDKKELAIAIENAKKRIANKRQNEHVASLLNYLKRQNSNDQVEKIGVPTQDGFIFLAPDEVIRCEGYNAYTKLYLGDGTHIISSYNLAQFRKILPEDYFFQVHKSHIISLNKVRKYNSKDSLVEMDNGDSIPVSRKVKTNFIGHFKIPKR